MDGKVVVLTFRLGFLRGPVGEGIVIVSDVGW